VTGSEADDAARTTSAAASTRNLMKSPSLEVYEHRD
jgi:hypothetical protein